MTCLWLILALAVAPGVTQAVATGDFGRDRQFSIIC